MDGKDAEENDSSCDEYDAETDWKKAVEHGGCELPVVPAFHIYVWLLRFRGSVSNLRQHKFTDLAHLHQQFVGRSFRHVFLWFFRILLEIPSGTDVALVCWRNVDTQAPRKFVHKPLHLVTHSIHQPEWQRLISRFPSIMYLIRIILAFIYLTSMPIRSIKY